MKRLTFAALLAVSLSAPADAAEPLSQPVFGEWLVSAFKALCFDPFGDRTKLTEAVGKSDAGFTETPQDPATPMPGTSGWESPKAVLAYTDGTLLPQPLPSPQCLLNVRVAAGYDHAATAASLAAALGLAPARARGKNGRFTSEWNYAGPKGEKRRIFLRQEPAADGPRVRIALLNLR